MTDKVTRGTTPIICFTYTDVDTSRITAVYMTMRQRGQVVKSIKNPLAIQNLLC